MKCVLSKEAVLGQCVIIEETPPNFGFGSSAQKIAAAGNLFVFQPKIRDGVPVESEVIIPVNFEFPRGRRASDPSTQWQTELEVADWQRGAGDSKKLSFWKIEKAVNSSEFYISMRIEYKVSPNAAVLYLSEVDDYNLKCAGKIVQLKGKRYFTDRNLIHESIHQTQIEDGKIDSESMANINDISEVFCK